MSMRTMGSSSLAPAATPWIIILPNGWNKTFPSEEAALAAAASYPGALVAEAEQADAKAYLDAAADLAEA